MATEPVQAHYQVPAETRDLLNQFAKEHGSIKSRVLSRAVAAFKNAIDAGRATRPERADPLSRSQSVRVAVFLDVAVRDWIAGQAGDWGITAWQVVTEAVRFYDDGLKSGSLPRPPKETRLASPGAPKKAATAKAPKRAELPTKVPCPVCGRAQWPDMNGQPRYHERAARPGDSGYSEIVPTYVPCEAVPDGASSGGVG